MIGSWEAFQKAFWRQEEQSHKVWSLEYAKSYSQEKRGQHIRPRLVHQCAGYFGYWTEKHVKLARIVEYIHTASLFHDDIIDNSSLRRGCPSAHILWGVPHAILAGDFLLTEAFGLLISLESFPLMEKIYTMTQELLEGQAQELTMSKDLSFKDYIYLVRKKTASLFAVSCHASAFLSGASLHDQKFLYWYGLYLGIAYQLEDDAMEYDSPVDTWEKGHDFVEGKITYPFLVALREGSQALLQALENRKKESWIGEAMEPFVQKTRFKAERYRKKAQNILQKFLKVREG